MTMASNQITLAQLEGEMTVAQLEKALLAAFPAEDAEDWDYTGLTVGNPDDVVKAVAVALDPTVSAMKQAIAMGANVLVTHHPVFLDAPTCFLPYEHQGQTPGAGVNYALSHGLNCMNFHTACDVSAKGLAAVPELLGLTALVPFDLLQGSKTKGFGMLCGVDALMDAESDSNTALVTLSDLAQKCVATFDAVPRVWGDKDKVISRVVCCGGSAGFLLQKCLEEKVDCLICGEVKYHDCLDACESGLTVIELGHDISEFPLCEILLHSIVDAGVDSNCITIINQKPNWFTPVS